MTKRVLLATKGGSRPSQCWKQRTALLVLHDWNPQYCFWTLTMDHRRYVVHFKKSKSDDGPHWRRWLGVRDCFEDKAIAFPTEACFPVADDAFEH